MAEVRLAVDGRSAGVPGDVAPVMGNEFDLGQLGFRGIPIFLRSVCC